MLLTMLEKKFGDTIVWMRIGQGKNGFEVLAENIRHSGMWGWGLLDG